MPKSDLTVMIQAEVDADKHARYKVAAGQEGITLKRMIVKALDEYIKNHHNSLMIINLKIP